MSIINPELHYKFLSEPMTFTKEVKYDFDDITLVPETISKVNSRKEVDPFIEISGEKFLPLMTAPMDTVVNEENMEIFQNNRIITCLPRGENIYSHYETVFPSISLDDAKLLLDDNIHNHESYYCIDMANGHMDMLIQVVRELSDKRPDIKLIVGNIANPNTYKVFAELPNVWGVRVGVGGGGACFIEGTKITTIEGEKNIEDITIKDVILTHDLTYQKVITTHVKESDFLIKINDTISTSDHEYYVLHKNFKDIVTDENIHEYAKFIKAENLSEDHLIISMGG